jgi:hypothetical protein
MINAAYLLEVPYVKRVFVASIAFFLGLFLLGASGLNFLLSVFLS